MSPTEPAPVAILRQRKPRRPTRRRSSADLDRAETLRPADIFARFGIAPSTINAWCNLPEGDRLPSLRIGSWRGRKGIRLIYRADLLAWLEWQNHISAAERAGEPRPADTATFALWRAKKARPTKTRRAA